MNEDSLRRFLMKLQEFQEMEKQRELSFGKIRPIMHADVNGVKGVVVGSEVLFSKNWRTFPDFLMNYIWHVLGRDWASKEISKPFHERHQILQWYDGVRKFRSKQEANEDGLCRTELNGVFAAFLFLAYDLYLLRHHLALQNYVINRLKDSDQFQGARYELYATATCIRAGFEIQFEDEQSANTKHVEFIAVHRATGQKVAIEAKSRHRKGVLGYLNNSSSNGKFRLKIVPLINQALQKKPTVPLVVFIDLNLPVDILKRVFQGNPAQKILKVSDRVKKLDNGNDIFSLIIFTNIPHHYGREDESDLPKSYFYVFSQNPEIKPDYPQALQDILPAVSQYGQIPNEFPEKDELVF